MSQLLAVESDKLLLFNKIIKMFDDSFFKSLKLSVTTSPIINIIFMSKLTNFTLIHRQQSAEYENGTVKTERYSFTSTFYRQ